MVLGFDNPFAPPTGSFPLPVVAPDVDSDEPPLITVCFNAAWLPFIMGALQQLTLQATWQGDADAVLLAQSRAQLLLANFASTTGGCIEGVCFDGIVYDPDTDTVKQTFDGGSTYVDAPYADPRHALSFQKPPLTTDAQCQAAANAVQNIKAFIDQLLLIIDDAGDALGLVGLITDIISIFIPIGIFFDIILDLAALMFGLTGTVINAAFTPTVYDQLLCILYCRTELDGTWTATDLIGIETDIADQIGGTVQAVMEGLFLLTGEVGLSNMGIQGTATADCSGCDCSSCYTWLFTESDGGWIPYLDRGDWVDGEGWNAVAQGSGGYIEVVYTFPSPIHLTNFAVTYGENCAFNPIGSGTWLAYVDGTGEHIIGGLSNDCGSPLNINRGVGADDVTAIAFRMEQNSPTGFAGTTLIQATITGVWDDEPTGGEAC
jgi:hypothetical protein